MFEKIEQLRKLPDQKKRMVALAGASGVTAIIFVFWVVSLSVTLASPSSTDAAVAAAAPDSPFKALQANVAAAVAPMGDAVHTVASYFTTAGSTTPPVEPPTPVTPPSPQPQAHQPVSYIIPTISQPASPSPSSPVATPSTLTRFLIPGDSGADVVLLQKVLTQQGFYDGPLNGKFGPSTVSALIKFQAARGIASTKADGAGLVGTKTMTFINQLLQR